MKVKVYNFQPTVCIILLYVIIKSMLTSHGSIWVRIYSVMTYYYTNTISCNVNIIESVDSISRDGPDTPYIQYITNTQISQNR